MKEFIKTSTGLSNVDNAKIKIYSSVEAAEDALANGCLAAGDVIATQFVDGAGDITANIQTLADTVSTISAEIPSGTNAIDNTLVNQSMLSEATGGAINVCCGSTCVCSISAAGNALVLDAVAFDGVTSLANRVCTLETAGYTTCEGTVTAICQGTCCYTPASGVVTIPEADMSRVTALESCPGLDCVGTVTSVNNCTPDASGNVTVEGGYDIDIYCSGTCVCSITKDAAALCLNAVAFDGAAVASYSLSGNQLTITI